MLNLPTRADSAFFLRSLARAFSLGALALVAMGTASAFAQPPAAAAAGPTRATAAPAFQPATSDAQPTAQPAQPYYPAPPPYYYPAPPPGYSALRPNPTASPAPRPEPTFLVASLALGLGTPYGIIGGGFTLGFDYLSVIAGVGSALFEGLGYGAGLRAHFLDTSHRWRPHFTAVYGTTCIYRMPSFYSGAQSSGVLRGFGFYLGIDQDFGEPGAWFATYGLGYITHEELPASVRNAIGGSPQLDMPIDILVAFGYRFGGK